MFSGVSTLCFATAYAVALALEASRLWFRSRLRGIAMIGFAAAGLVAHTVFLYHRAASQATQGAPLSSQQDWFFVAAWALVVLYLYLSLLHRRWPFGLFLLPLALALVAAGRFMADSAPLGREPASRIWGAIHGLSIVLAAVAVLFGFVAGLMYLGQQRHLKRKIVSTRSLRLPSLEWLRGANYRAMVVSVLMLGVGILAGMVLNRIHARDKSLLLNWSDPVVLSTWLTFVWLASAVILCAFYRNAKQGQAVAYLTIVSFVFLAVMLAAGLWAQSQHWGNKGERGEGRGKSKHEIAGLCLPLCPLPSPLSPPPPEADHVR
ncbi:MAG: hypothetical protein ABFC96_07405 [Thermoguttaceae bacterium]